MVNSTLFSFGDSNAVFPSITISLMPPTLVLTTPLPAACASIRLTGVPSLLEVNAIISSPATGLSISIIHEVNVIVFRGLCSESVL